MVAGHRVAMRLALALGVGIAVTVAGCGGSASATASASPSDPASGSSLLPSVIACLNGHGMTVPAGATAKQVEAAFKAASVSERHSAYSACEQLLPAKVRQRVQRRLAKAAATPSAT